MNTCLNTENIARSKGGVEYHPLHPFLPENAKVLFLGSFPPQRKRWCMDFYYPNFINDHWRIEGQIFFGDKNHFVDLEAKRFKIDDEHDKAIAYHDKVEPKLDSIRYEIDKLELIVDDALWPLPKYRELLFIR